MRPLLLKIKGFGPYAEETVIPMEELGEKGLYLITGDTGAGKTTIFDAICYGLYGEASGNNRESTMLRSKYAAPETPTEVELTFSHGGNEYVIKRNPEYMRPAKRGEGLKKEIAAAQLQFPDGKVISRVKEVTAAVEELLGMTREQFCQISMLAQGDFLKLLLADTRQRQEIFRKLFHTERYQTLQYKLEEERKQIYGSCMDARKSIEQFVAGITYGEDSLWQAEAERAKHGELTMAEQMEVLSGLIEEDTGVQKHREKEAASLEKELEKINHLLGRAAEIQKTKEELEKVKQQLSEETEKEKNTHERLTKAKKAADGCEGIHRQVSAIEAQLPGYDAYEQLLKELDMVSEQKEKLLADLERDAAREGEQTKLLKLQKEELEALGDAGIRKERLKSEAEKVEHIRKQIDTLKKKVEDTEGTRKETEACQEAYIRDDKYFRECSRIYEQMERAYRHGQAGILAAALQEGECCPVCGSTVHPKPAGLSLEVPTDEQLKVAKAQAEKAREQAFQSSQRAGELMSICKLRQEEIQTEWKSLSQQTDSAEMTVAVDMTGMAEMLSEKSRENKQHYEELQTEIRKENEKEVRKAELEKTIPLAEAKLQQLKEEMAGKKETVAVLSSKQETMKKQADRMKETLQFKDGAEARARCRELQEQIRQLQGAYEAAQAEYNDRTKRVNMLKGQQQNCEKTLENAEKIDVDGIGQQKEELMQQRISCTKMLQMVATRLETNKGIRIHIEKRAEELAERERKLQWIGALADTAGGKLRGKEKIMLETYIQTTYFDRILARANLRLLKMSSAQYELKRMEEAGTNKGQSGLELGVIDHYNGSVRSVKTLSGGESFLASLSLALGLSDEVQASAGGIYVDTLFVDEGFGSLDGDTLELAYRTLAALTEGNRLVGIISHVSDLKEKIDRQIVVTKEKSGGSRVKLIV